MRKDSLTTYAQRAAVLALSVSIASGCAQTQSWMDGMRKSPPVSGDPVILGAPDAEHYLNELYSLAAGDPATQAEIFADAESGARLTPGPQTALRFALVLATPGHPEANPQQAQALLREILTQPELLTPAEIALATIHLKANEELIVRDAEARRLRASTSQAARTEEAAVNQRLANVEAENRRLRRELEDAEEKLDAITSIERSIRAQEQ